MASKRIIAASVTLVLLAAAASAETWRTYVNERFGATAEVPADWRAGEPPANGDGLEFTSPDGTASITISGGLNVWDTIDEAMAIYEAPDAGETVTYRFRKDRTVVVSGTADGRIFYRKSVLACGDRVWNDISIEYPAENKASFDALVTRVARSLRPGKSAQVPECP